jgi:hypothetical protein
MWRRLMSMSPQGLLEKGPCALRHIVGMRRFELPTSSTPCWRDTGLRYIPKIKNTHLCNIAHDLPDLWPGRDTGLRYIPNGATNIIFVLIIWIPWQLFAFYHNKFAILKTSCCHTTSKQNRVLPFASRIFQRIGHQFQHAAPF